MLLTPQTYRLLEQLGWPPHEVDRALREASEGRDATVVNVIHDMGHWSTCRVGLLLCLSAKPADDASNILFAGRIVAMPPNETPKTPRAVCILEDADDEGGTLWFVPDADAPQEDVARDIQRATAYVGGVWRPWWLDADVILMHTTTGWDVTSAKECIVLSGDCLLATDETEELWWQQWEGLLQKVAEEALQALSLTEIRYIIEERKQRLDEMLRAVSLYREKSRAKVDGRAER